MPGCIRAQYSQCGETDATGGAGSGGGSVVRFRFAFDDVGPAAKGAVELDHLGGLAPFCGA
jgi:hypothetical protein